MKACPAPTVPAAPPQENQGREKQAREDPAGKTAATFLNWILKGRAQALPGAKVRLTVNGWCGP
jgi:hypothetical protein